MSKCSIYEFPQQQCTQYPGKCDVCAWREGGKVTKESLIDVSHPDGKPCRLYHTPWLACSSYPNCDKCVYNADNKTEENHTEGLMWRRAKAGRSFGKDTIVIYDGDPDPRLVKCAVNDCVYIHVDDLKKLPIDEQK